MGVGLASVRDFHISAVGTARGGVHFLKHFLVSRIRGPRGWDRVFERCSYFCSRSTQGLGSDFSRLFLFLQ